MAEALDLSWGDFCALLRESLHRGSKETAPGWSPCALKSCAGPCRNSGNPKKFDCGGGALHRLTENALEVCSLVLDCDKLPASILQRVLEAVDANEYVIHSTASHDPGGDKHCYRVVLPLSQPVPAQDWTSARTRFLEAAGIAARVDDVKDAVRFYYVPTVPLSGAPPEFEHHPGEILDLGAPAGVLVDIPRPHARVRAAGAPSPFAAPEPSPPLEAAREALLSWKSPDPDKRERARLLARGKPFAEQGRRDAAFTALVGQVLGAWPWVEDDVLEALFLPSLGEMVSRDGDSTVERELEKLWDKVSRFRDGAQEHRLQELAEEESRKRGLDALARRLRQQGAPEPRRSQAFSSVLSEEDIPPAPEAEWSRPTIQVTPIIEEMVEQAEEAVANDPRVFCSSGFLVRLCVSSGRPLPFKQDGQDMPRVAPIGTATLRAWLSTDAEWLVPEGDAAKAVMPPAAVVSALEEHGAWPHVRRLSGFAETPVFRRDGSLLSSPGWDPQTGLYYAEDSKLYVPDVAPSLEDARSAVAELLDVVADFPFADGAARSAWLCALLTPFVRQDLPGLCPMFVADANTQGSGKTKLVDLISLVCSGRVLAKLPNTTDDDEMRKALLAIALEGTTCVMLDNVRGTLGTPSLESALTAGWVKGRVLGENRTAQAPLKACWFASGNNVEYEGDLVRRVLQIRLVSPLERPYERGNFRHHPIERWVLAERPRLVAACIRTWRAYFAAGAPPSIAQPWGSFEEWQALLFGLLEWLGQPSPDGARLRASAAPAEREQVVAILSALRDVAKDGWCAVSAFVAKAAGPGAANAQARGALQELCGDRGDQVLARKVSRLFAKHKEVVMQGMRLIRKEGEAGALWRVETILENAHQKG